MLALKRPSSYCATFHSVCSDRLLVNAGLYCQIKYNTNKELLFKIGKLTSSVCLYLCWTWTTSAQRSRGRCRRLGVHDPGLDWTVWRSAEPRARSHTSLAPTFRWNKRRISFYIINYYYYFFFFFTELLKHKK